MSTAQLQPPLQLEDILANFHRYHTEETRRRVGCGLGVAHEVGTPGAALVIGGVAVPVGVGDGVSPKGETKLVGVGG
eukprot:6990727-Pyramimonas_sp.AAC.1